MSKRDSNVHWLLKNWAKAQNIGMIQGGVPSQHPKGSSWAQKIVNPGDTLDDDLYIDEDNAESTQHAMIRLMIHNIKAATILTKHYRDGWNLSDRAVRRARNMLWKYL